MAAAAFLAAAIACWLPLFFPPAFFAFAAASLAFIATAGSTSAGSADSSAAAGSASASSVAVSSFAASSVASASGFFFPFFFFFYDVVVGAVVVTAGQHLARARVHAMGTFFFEEASASAVASTGAQVAAPSASCCSPSGLAGELTSSAATFSLSISGLLGLSIGGTLGVSLNVAMVRSRANESLKSATWRKKGTTDSGSYLMLKIKMSRVRPPPDLEPDADRNSNNYNCSIQGKRANKKLTSSYLGQRRRRGQPVQNPYF